MEDLTWILHHMGEDNMPMNAVNPPIFQTSNFCFDSFERFRQALTDELSECLYTRGNNPTVNLVESKLAALEHGEKAKLLGSGAAAITNAVMAFVGTGDHIVCVNDPYTWAGRLIGTYLARFGVEHTFVDGRDTDRILEAIRPETKVIYLESPTSLTFSLQDVPAIAAAARSRGIKTIIDNTWATPLYCNPIDYGVDIVLHSASKYLGGNSDLVAGAVIGRKEDIELIIRQESLQFGAVADPFMAWLVMRGMRTLHLRMPVHYANALAIARYLKSHPMVEQVLHPFLESHPQHELAARLMRGGSGLFSFRLKTRKLEHIIRFVNSLKVFKRAVSWGGYESLVYPKAASYKPGVEIPEQDIRLIRLHVGLENSELLLSDLEQALEKIE